MHNSYDYAFCGCIKHSIHGGAAASLHLQQDIEIQPRETVYSYIRWYCHSWETNSRLPHQTSVHTHVIYDDFLDDLTPSFIIDISILNRSFFNQNDSLAIFILFINNPTLMKNCYVVRSFNQRLYLRVIYGILKNNCIII